jgi:hypothetical protein
MKKVLLPLALIGTLFLTACDKDELASPELNNEVLSVKEKALECSCGGASWDITDPDAQASVLSSQSITADYDGTDSETISKPKRNK